MYSIEEDNSVLDDTFPDRDKDGSRYIGSTHLWYHVAPLLSVRPTIGSAEMSKKDNNRFPISYQRVNLLLSTVLVRIFD